jgi:hypothetical protein
MPASKQTKLPANYEIAEPEARGVFPMYPSAEQAKMFAVAPRAVKPGGIEKRAVWIVHGMGQQIPFETVDSLTEGLMSAAKLPTGQTAFAPKARSIRVGDQVLQRVELQVAGESGKTYELHLYEAYWAPLTEGVANLRDVTSFLLNGALRGILNSFKRFQRAIFGEVWCYEVTWHTPVYISAILLILAALAVMNVVIVAATAAQLELFSIQLPIGVEQWNMLAALGSAISAVAIALGAVLFLAEMCKSPQLSSARRLWLGFVSWTGIILTACAIMAGAALFALIAAEDRIRGWVSPPPSVDPPAIVVASAKSIWHWLLRDCGASLQGASTLLIFAVLAVIAVALFVRGWKRSNRAKRTDFANSGILVVLLGVAFLIQIAAMVSPFAPGLRDRWGIDLNPWVSSSWWVWPFLAIVGAQVRLVLIEYVGDVAIYITPNKADRFSETRDKIKNTARQSASAVYLAMNHDGSDFEYEHVAVIGHSLGSVIAYDTLNRLINDDRLSQNKLRIAGRTCLFETFGSPLNKIAFLFTIQGKDSFQIREQLAEVVQPMIMNYGYRPFPWINVRSGNDIISGEVYLYDVDGKNSTDCAAGKQVPSPAGAHLAVDVIDKDAAVALAAHVDYWKNKTVWEQLCKYVAP